MVDSKKEKKRNDKDKIEIEFDKESEEVMKKLMRNIYGGVVSISWARIFNRNFKKVLNAVGDLDKFMIMAGSEKNEYVLIFSIKGSKDTILLFNRKYFGKFKKAFKEYMNLDFEKLEIITKEDGEDYGSGNKEKTK